MEEILELRTPESKTWRHSTDPHRHVRYITPGTRLHYPTAGPDSSVLDGEVDFSPQRVITGQLDGWQIVKGNWHYAVGKPGDMPTDGWVGFGGRQGAHWFKYRLLRVGYLHWSTRTWQDVGGIPTYDRGNLSNETDTLIIGPPGSEMALNVSTSMTWANIWQTPGGGVLNVSWRADGRRLKEDIRINPVAREWITANRPPTTPIAETWLGFVLQLDISDVPKWVINQIVQDIDGDFDDDGGEVELRDTMDRLLAFMPVSYAYSDWYQIGVDDEGQPVFDRDVVRLRKRVWRSTDGNHYLLVGARVDQLAAMHAGGITFDPTLDTQPGSEGIDCHIKVSLPRKHYNREMFEVNLGTDTYIKAFIKFDCSSIPSSATCDDATLSFWTLDTKTSNKTLPVHELLAANDGWLEGVNSDPGYGLTVWDHKLEETSEEAGDEVDWAGSVGCSTSGTDYASTAIGTGNYIANDPIGTEIAIDLTPGDVEDWFGESNLNYGLVFFGGAGSTFPQLASSDNSTPEYRPRLVVNYTTGQSQVLQGAADGAGVANGAMEATRPLIGAADGAAATAGALPIARALLGAAAGAGTADGELIAALALLGVIDGIAAASGAMKATRPLAGTASGMAMAGASLPILRALLGTADGAATVDGELIAALALLGAADGVAASIGAMEATRPLVGVADGVATVDGSLPILHALLGAMTGVATADGKLIAALGLLGAVDGIATTGGVIKATRPLTGAAVGAAATAGALPIARALLGAADGAGTADGLLQVLHWVLLAGITSGMGQANGVLPVARLLTGTIPGIGQAAGALPVARSLDGAAGGAAMADGMLPVAKPLVASIAGSGAASGDVIVARFLAGIAEGAAISTADLIVLYALLASIGGLSSVAGELAAVPGWVYVVGSIRGPGPGGGIEGPGNAGGVHGPGAGDIRGV